MGGELQAELAYVVAGLAILGAAVVPRLLATRPLSLPIVYLVAGLLLFVLPTGMTAPDPLEHTEAARRLTEGVVIVSLMGVGLQLDRPVGWRRWATTWRLLGIGMPITIALTAALGWAVGLVPATALLLGAVIAPTDPVLASDVQVDRPGGEEEDEVRFGLTSEAGLNDALAFPVVYAAIAAGGAATLTDWVGGWFLEDVVLRLSIGGALGLLLGHALAWVIFRWPDEVRPARSADGYVALAATFVVYGITELAHGYGFLAVFVAACTLRSRERGHRHHRVLHEYAESTERLLAALLLVLVGGAIAGGALNSLTAIDGVVVVALVLVVRPVAGWISLIGSGLALHERAALSFFGIRGMGSLFYLAYATATSTIEGAERIWALTIATIVLSVLVHGLTSTPVMGWLDRRTEADPRPGAVSD